MNTSTFLPPRRVLEHQIKLKEKLEPIKVRTYRYPHFQKDEIVKMVQENLKAGITQLSMSPYASLVLLVKRKDKSWNFFYVDCKALNKVTVSDKFPITIINELLNELRKSIIFSKIDLKDERLGY